LAGYRGQLDGEAEVCVGFINDGTTHMQNLLADLLSYTETSADKGETSEPIDLNRVFEKVTQNLTRAIEESGAVVTGGALPTVHGQEARFVQLFQNLIGNAIKYHSASPPLFRFPLSNENTSGSLQRQIMASGSSRNIIKRFSEC
jgi:chemotaxis family two-component system sensor kinase Cph1